MSAEDLKALAQHIHGQKKGLARLVDEFHEKHKIYAKKEIEAQIKTMANYEKRGADPRLKYYLTNEMQEKYGVKVHTYPIDSGAQRTSTRQIATINITIAGCE